MQPIFRLHGIGTITRGVSHHTRKPDFSAIIPLIAVPVQTQDTQCHCMQINACRSVLMKVISWYCLIDLALRNIFACLDLFI